MHQMKANRDSRNDQVTPFINKLLLPTVKISSQDHNSRVVTALKSPMIRIPSLNSGKHLNLTRAKSGLLRPMREEVLNNQRHSAKIRCRVNRKLWNRLLSLADEAHGLEKFIGKTACSRRWHIWCARRNWELKVCRNLK